MKIKKHGIPGLLLLAALLLAWEFSSRGGLVSSIFLPPFTEVFSALAKLIWSGELLKHIFFTLSRCFGGYFLACLIAIPSGIAMGRWRFIHGLFGPLVELLRPLPSAAVIPVAILFLGIFNEMKIFVIMFGSLWPILLNTIDGVRSTDPVLLDTGRTLNMTGRQMVTKIVIPAASPNIFTGMRISLAIALILAITVEMIAGNNGLGFYILDWERSFHFKEMYAGILALALVGYFLNFLFLRLDRRVLRWHKGFTRAVL